MSTDITRHRVEDLLHLMARLRKADTGCPWDIKQDFQSIIPHTLEETYEVVDAIAAQSGMLLGKTLCCSVPLPQRAPPIEE